MYVSSNSLNIYFQACSCLQPSHTIRAFQRIIKVVGSENTLYIHQSVFRFDSKSNLGTLDSKLALDLD